MIGSWKRLRDIFSSAPWSNHDLLAALIVLGMGGLILCQRAIFKKVDSYEPLGRIGSEQQWGSLFIVIGSFALLVTLWCRRPSFLIRMISRMSIVFCFLSFTINHLLLSPIPIATSSYLGLALWSFWGAIRTHSNGR